MVEVGQYGTVHLARGNTGGRRDRPQDKQVAAYHHHLMLEDRHYTVYDVV